MNIINQIKKKIFIKLISSLQKGTLKITFEDGHSELYIGKEVGRTANLKIYDSGAYAKILSASDIGLAEAYRDGWLDTEDMAGLLLLCIDNQDVLNKAFRGSKIGMMFYRLRHLLNSNTKKQSRKNIEAHYDLGNNFYKLWLDPSMTYSSALFKSEDESLEQAQKNKYQRIIDTLKLTSSHHILEIGCGWGGFATMAAEQSGCKVTCLTLSNEQFVHATTLVKQKNLAHLVEIKLCDYRDERGVYDHIVSIEMIEAVGQDHWSTYFATLNDRLRPGGKVMIQSITIDDEHFENYRNSTDFIQQYIFPGGMLLAPKIFTEYGDRHQLQMNDFFAFGLDYAKTLRLWREEFLKKINDVKKIGFDDRFLKLWDFYYVYCEAGFLSRRIDVVQVVYQKNS